VSEATAEDFVRSRDPRKVTVLPGRSYAPRDLVRILVRRKWLILLPFIVTSALGHLVAVGPVFGLLAGLALVVAAESFNSTFSCEEEVVRALSLPVLGAISSMTSEADRGWPRWRVVVDLVGFVLLFGSSVVLVLWRMRP
jgi:hypothetical protein